MSEVQRISERQARKSVKKANPERQFGDGAIPRFITHSSNLVDLFAKYIEVKMPLTVNSGSGCRVQTKHVDACYQQMQQKLMEIFLEEL